MDQSALDDHESIAAHRRRRNLLRTEASTEVTGARGYPHGPAQQPLLLRAEEVSALIGIGRTKVYEMIAAGELPVVRIGTSVRVPHGRLLAWIDKRTQS